MQEPLKIALVAAAGWTAYRLYTGQPIMPSFASSSATAAPVQAANVPATVAAAIGAAAVLKATQTAAGQHVSVATNKPPRRRA